MWQYDDLLVEILDEGEPKMDRTGVGCRSLFGPQLWFDLFEDGFPAVYRKKLQWKSVVKELLWFIRGETNTKTLGCGIWDQWADENGECGPIYGEQWREWQGVDQKRSLEYGETILRDVDQLQDVITNLKTNPQSRRHIVSAWNVADLPQMGLPPCHLLFQFHVGFERAPGQATIQVPTYLDCKMTQRSADVFLGVPFNIAQYALLTHMVGKLVGLTPRNLIISFGDVHIYDNHVDAVDKYLTSPVPLGVGIEPVTLKMPEFSTLQELEKCDPKDFELENYIHGPAIPAPVAI